MNIEIPIQGQSASGGGYANQNSQANIPPQQPNTPPSGTSSSGTSSSGIPDYLQRNGGQYQANQNRLIEDARREMQARGVLMIPGSQNMSTFLNQFGGNIRESKKKEIQEEYNESRKLLGREKDEELAKLEKEKEKKISAQAQNWYGDSTVRTDNLDDWWNKHYGKSYRRKVSEINTQYSENLREINAEEKEELATSDKELVRAIKDLTRYFENEARENGVNNNSFLNQLKKEREKAIFERDNAEDEDEARKAAKKANELNDRIKDIINDNDEEGGGDESSKKDYGARVLQMMTGVSQITNGMANRSIGSVVSGAGGVITNMLPLSDASSAKAMGVVAALASVASLFQQSGDKETIYSQLAPYVRTSNPEDTIANVRADIANEIYNYSPNAWNPAMHDIGMSDTDFAASAKTRIAQRGMGGWEGINEAYYQEVLERVFALQGGSLGQAGMFDRYGRNATNEFAKLIAALESSANSGIKEGQYTRANEYLQLQQGMMQSQLGFADTPSYDYANQMISRFANFKNYQVDSRTGGDIQALQGMVLNPSNDRAKALLYNVVEKLYPSARGRLDKIDQILHDPEKMTKIMQEYAKDIQLRYGGYDTETGYFAAQAALQGVSQPGRRRAIWEGIQGDNYSFVNDNGEGLKDNYALQAQNYVTDITQGMTSLQDFVYNVFYKLNELIDRFL